MGRLRLLIGALGVVAVAALAGGLPSSAGGGVVLGSVNGEELCPGGLTIGGKPLNLDSFTPENLGPPIRTDPNTTGGFRCQYVAAPGVFVQSTRITFTYYREKRAAGSRFCDTVATTPGFLNSASHDIQVFVSRVVDGHDSVREGVLSKAEALNIGWPCDDTGAPAPNPPPASPPPASPPPAVPPTQVQVPEPGKTTTVKLPVGRKSTEATVTIGADAVEEFALGFNEKAQRLNKLQRFQKRLLALCWVMVIQQTENAALETRKDVKNTLGFACSQQLEAIQEQMDELQNQQRNTQAAAGQDASCLLVQTPLRLVKPIGKPPVVTVVEKGLPPRLNISCEATETGLELTIRRRGKGTLRQALGKSLILTIRHSNTAPTPDPGETLTIAYSQQ